MTAYQIVFIILAWIFIGIIPVTYLSFMIPNESKKFRKKVGNKQILYFYLLGGLFGLITFGVWILFQFFVYNKNGEEIKE